MRTPWWLLAVVILSGCGLFEPESEERQKFNDALAAWKRQGFENYYYVFREYCECPVETQRPHRVIVHGDRVVEVTVVENGATLQDVTYFMTIDALFTHIKQALDRPVDRIEVTYDRTLHYPVSIYVDRDRRVADDEYTMQLSTLTRLD